MMTECPANGDYLEVFKANYKREFGFVLQVRIFDPYICHI